MNMTFQKGHKINLGRFPSKTTRLNLSISKAGFRNNFYGKHHSAKTKRRISQAFTEERKQALQRRNINNNYLKDFLKTMDHNQRAFWLIEMGRKISQAFTPIRRKEYSIRMHKYRKSHPMWTPPDWSNRETGFSVPEFVPLLPGRITPIDATRYYTQGVIPAGLTGPILSGL